MKNKSNLLTKIIIGGLFSIVILVLAALHVMDIKIAFLVLIIMLLGFITMGFFERRFKPDERIRRLDYRAISWSYMLTLILVSVYILLDNWGIFTLSALQLAGFILFFMIFSSLIIQFIFRKRSDVSD